jgi:hypothetical protein
MDAPAAASLAVVVLPAAGAGFPHPTRSADA